MPSIFAKDPVSGKSKSRQPRRQCGKDNQTIWPADPLQLQEFRIRKEKDMRHFRPPGSKHTKNQEWGR